VEFEREQWIKARGIFLVEPKMGRIVLGLGHDFTRLYAYFLEEAHKQRYSYSAFGGHISIALEKIHKKINYAAANQFRGEWVDFEYNPDMITGGKKSGVPNYWLRVRSSRIDEIKKIIGVVDDYRHLGSHITIASHKNGVRKYQKQAIEIR
jgi:hypothetical protein